MPKQRIEELLSDLNAHRQGWVQWSEDVLKEKINLLIKLENERKNYVLAT